MTRDFAPLIHPATRTDAGVLAELAAATFVETFGHLYPPADLTAFLAEARCAARYARLLDDPTVFVGLVMTGEHAAGGQGIAAGYVVAGGCKLPVANLEPSAGEIRELYLRAGQQNRGLGSRLLTSALAWLGTRQRAPIYLGVWSGNSGAQRFYRRFGFEKIGEHDFPVGRQKDREYILRRGGYVPS